jgi:hypothetical protein
MCVDADYKLKASHGWSDARDDMRQTVVKRWRRKDAGCRPRHGGTPFVP